MALSWLLFRRSLRHSKGRLALISLSVAFGVCLLLGFAAFFHAFGDTRSSDWKEVVEKEMLAQLERTEEERQQEEKAPDGVRAHLLDSFEQGGLHQIQGKSVTVLYVDTQNATSLPDFYGMIWPKYGEYLISEGVKKAMETRADDHIGGRFGKECLGLTPWELTRGPDDLLVVAGMDLSDDSRAAVVRDFRGSVEGNRDKLVNQSIMTLGVVVLLFPVIILIAVSAKLGSAQREQRYAALRLAGATKKQIAQILLVEAWAGGLIGYALGVMIFLLIQPSLSQIVIVNDRLWPNRLAIPLWQYGLVFVLSIFLVAIANGWGVRRLSVSPLGTVRRSLRQRPISFLSAIPLLLSLGMVIYFALRVDRNAARVEDLQFLIITVILMMVGLVLILPWVTQTTAGALSQHTSSAPALLGAKYVVANARSMARSVSGMVLALFAGVFFLTVTSDAKDLIGRMEHPSPLKPSAFLLSQLANKEQASALQEVLRDKDYIAKTDLLPTIAGAYHLFSTDQSRAYLQEASSAHQIAMNFWALPEEPRSRIEVNDEMELKGILEEKFGADPGENEDWALAVSLRAPTDADRLCSDLLASGIIPPDQSSFVIFGDQSLEDTSGSFIVMMTWVVYAAMGVTLMIAVVSMMVSTYAALLERRRSLVTLRLSGMQVFELVKMMFLESWAPLLGICLFTVAVAYSTAWILMQKVSMTLDAHLAPGVFVILIMALGLAFASLLAMIPVLRKVSSPEHNRQE